MRLLALIILQLAASGLRPDLHADSATNLVSTNDLLIIDRCFTSVAGGKCTLTFGPLRAKGDVYCGDYNTKVSPYFFKNEGGTLAILITRADIEKASAGQTVEITGTATQSSKAKKSRHINATATPLNPRQGTLRFRFLADDREMIFDTYYKFVSPD